jgi:hypothetical protein
VLAGRSAEDLPPVPGAGTDPDAEFRLEPGDTVERLLTDYQEACAWSRATAAGHADTLREQLDGTTGT